jgi:hypothetical protein
MPASRPALHRHGAEAGKQDRKSLRAPEWRNEPVAIMTVFSSAWGNREEKASEKSSR